jgi:uncharacterized Zn-binding protein involved in type VI secretion
MAQVIRLNDPTSHGGIVVGVTSTSCIVSGLPVARVGDPVVCPIHGPGVIVQGESRHVIDGIPVAYDGHKTSCGASLISTVSNCSNS